MKVRPYIPSLDSTVPNGGIALPIKSTPVDIEIFHQETTVKYPTFAAPSTDPVIPSVPISTAKLAEAYTPIPVRHHYHHDEHDPHSSMLHHGHQGHPFHPHGSQSGFRGVPQSATPAPSPPPSPKPTKKQYQTDQNRPFLFPFSRSAGGGRYGRRDARDGQLVPFAIDEAERLYKRHMYVSLSLWQMWRTREECMTTESGLEYMPGSEGFIELPKPPNGVSMLAFVNALP